MWIYSVNNIAILNQDRFYNYGTIDIENSGESSGFLIVNSDQFRNYSSGIINLNSDIYGGISNASTSSNFKNYGNIDINEVSIGINNEGSLINYDGAFIDAQNNSSASYSNQVGGTITNHGYLFSLHSDAGIYNYGTLTNNKSFTVFYSDAYGSLRNFSTGVINNYDQIYLHGTSLIDLENDGSITNHYGGYFAINKTIDQSLGADFTNYGFFVSFGSNGHNISGVFENNGVIDDDYGQLQGMISNNRVLVAPVAGPMQVGVPYPNVLDIASLTDVNIGDWKISMNGTKAGTYDEVTNEFTPNASAVGLTTIYIYINTRFG